MTQPEALFKRKLRERFEEIIKDSYCTPIVAHLGQKSGLPDLYCAGLGASAWIEAKVKPNTLSELQRQVHKRMVRAGARVVVLSAHHMELAAQHRLIEIVEYDALGEPRPFRCYSWGYLKDEPFWRMVLGC